MMQLAEINMLIPEHFPENIRQLIIQQVQESQIKYGNSMANKLICEHHKNVHDEKTREYSKMNDHLVQLGVEICSIDERNAILAEQFSRIAENDKRKRKRLSKMIDENNKSRQKFEDEINLPVEEVYEQKLGKYSEKIRELEIEKLKMNKKNKYLQHTLLLKLIEQYQPLIDANEIPNNGVAVNDGNTPEHGGNRHNKTNKKRPKKRNTRKKRT
jgi:hypothetical protein